MKQIRKVYHPDDQKMLIFDFKLTNKFNPKSYEEKVNALMFMRDCIDSIEVLISELKTQQSNTPNQ